MCKHEHGDIVDGYWLCGQCYKKLDERPREYKQVKVKLVTVEDGGDQIIPRYRQEVFPAPIRRADSGFTLSEFIHVMARKLMAKASMSKIDALDYARDILEMMGEEFGCADMDWDTDAAWEIIKDDMKNWDYDGGGGNE